MIGSCDPDLAMSESEPNTHHGPDPDPDPDPHHVPNPRPQSYLKSGCKSMKKLIKSARPVYERSTRRIIPVTALAPALATARAISLSLALTLAAVPALSLWIKEVLESRVETEVENSIGFKSNLGKFTAPRAKSSQAPLLESADDWKV